jgi:very-long-chain enoyl-CoA reductase
MSWTTVFVLEYIGPILIHPLFLLLRPYIYSSNPPLSSSQILSFILIVLHFAKREYETLFVHKFSLSTMPWGNIWWNCGWYWLGAGLNIAPWIYAPFSYTALSSPLIDKINLVGVALYTFGQVSNFIVHLNLASLRSTGGTERKVPTGYGFNLVTCPNYMFELISWTGILLVSKSAGTALMLGLAAWKMNQWGKKKEKAYRAEFPETYKKKKYAVIPGVRF